MDSSDLSRSPSRSLSRSSDDYYHANHDDYDDVSDESHSSSEEESVRTTSSSSSPSRLPESPSPYRLPPREVLDLAKSLSNCCVVQPPPPSVGGATLRGNTNGSTRGRRGRSGSGSEGHPVPVAESATPASFSDWRRHFHRTFFDDDDDENDVRDEEPETILSFLATDPETETTDRGGNVARVDVYCRTGTVCTCRVVPVLSGDAVVTTALGSSDAASSPTSNSRTLFSSLLATPRTANGAGDASEGAGDKTSMTNHLPRPPHRVRRILRRNCSLAALRRILERPPRLLDIPPSLVADSVGSSRRSSVGSSTGSSLASTVSRALRRRKDRRRNERRGSPSLKTKTWHADPYTPEQRRFLEIQKRNHERRMRREERWRVRIAKSILAGEEDEEGFLEGRRWDDSEEEEDGVSLCHQGSMSETTASASTASEGWKAPRDVGLRAVKVEVETTTSEEMGAWYEEQKSIRRRIELADTALAILMGEAEVLEKMMAAFHPEEEEREADQENVAKEKTRESDRWQSQRNGRQTRDGRDDDDSVSTLDDTHEHDQHEHDDDSFYDESEAEEIAKLLQGCQIEYSFPFEHHADLEDALLPRRHSISDDDEDDTSHHASTDDSHTETDESKPSFATARPPHRRGRSLTSTRECTNQSRRVADSLPTYHLPPLPSVTAIPTDGEGCIVLRETGAFTVIGDLPRGLSEALFRRRGPLPSYIALGTKGRYYVRFEDGTSSFHGPASLDRLWNEPASSDTFRGTKAATRGKTNRRRRDHHPTPPKSHRPVPIASVAFGKEFTDYFLVRADGSWEANGDLPSGLEKLLDDRRHRGDLRWVALGPEGEWCVKARNGRVWWGGVSREIDEVLGDILIDGREELNFIDFGVEGSYFLIY